MTFISHLAYARNEAVTRSVQVGLCASDNTTSCSGDNWSLGWILFVDADNAGLNGSDSITIRGTKPGQLNIPE